MVQWGWISKLYHYPTYASFALDNGFATYKGAFLGVGFDRCINPAPGKSVTKNEAQPSPNNRSKGTLRE